MKLVAQEVELVFLSGAPLDAAVFFFRVSTLTLFTSPLY